MKTIKLLIVFALSFYIFQRAEAQTVNWDALENTRHIISPAVGWDYSISYSLGYGYQLKTKVPIVLITNFSIPSGENLLDDFKTKIGGQVLLLNTSNLKGGITIKGIYRRYENPLVRLQNFGSEMKGTLGYYKPRWFVAGEFGFDKAIVTNFEHSELYRETIYGDAKNGWYQPATGGNFLYGLQTGYSFKKADITLNFGKVMTQDFMTTPLIPFYLRLGYNHKIK